MTVQLGPRPVLLAIDCQNGFMTEHTQEAVKVVDDLMALWRSRDLPVFMTRFINYPGSPYERHIGWGKCSTSPEIDIIDSLAHHVDAGIPVVDKSIYSFFTPEWVERARAEGWSDAVITGLDTDGCVLKTALDAFELGISPWVVQDATASHSGQLAYDSAVYILGRTIGKGQMIRSSSALLTPAGLPPRIDRINI